MRSSPSRARAPARSPRARGCCGTGRAKRRRSRRGANSACRKFMRVRARSVPRSASASAGAKRSGSPAARKAPVDSPGGTEKRAQRMPSCADRYSSMRCRRAPPPSSVISSIAFSGGAPERRLEAAERAHQLAHQPVERALGGRRVRREVGAEDAVAALHALGFVPVEIALARDRLGQQRARRAAACAPRARRRRPAGRASSCGVRGRRAGACPASRRRSRGSRARGLRLRARAARARRRAAPRPARDLARACTTLATHVGGRARLADQLPVDEHVVEVEGRLALDLEGHRLRDAAAIAEREVDRAARDAVAGDRRRRRARRRARGPGRSRAARRARSRRSRR